MLFVELRLRVAEEESAARQCVLLICPLPFSSGQPGALYERVGIAILLASHLSAWVMSVSVV